MEAYNGDSLITRWEIGWLRIYQTVLGVSTLFDTVVELTRNDPSLQQATLIRLINTDRTEAIISAARQYA